MEALYYQPQSSYSRTSNDNYWNPMNQRADSQQQTNYQPSHWDSTRIRRASAGSDFYPNVPTGDQHQPTTLPPLNRYITPMGEPTSFDSNGRAHDGSDRDHQSDIVGADDLSRHSTSPLSASGTALSSVPHHHHHHHSHSHSHSHSHAMSSTVYQSGMTTTPGPSSSSSLQHSPKASRQYTQRRTYNTASVPRTNRTKTSHAIREVNGKLPRQQREMSDPSVNHPSNRLNRMPSDGQITPSEQIWHGGPFGMSGRGERTTYSPGANGGFSISETRPFQQVDAGGPNRLNYPPVVTGSPNAGVSDSSRIPASHRLSAGIDAAKHYPMSITSTNGMAAAAEAAINPAQFVPPALASPDHHHRSSTLDVNLNVSSQSQGSADPSQYAYSAADVPFASHGAYETHHLDNRSQSYQQQQQQSNSRVTTNQNQQQQQQQHDMVPQADVGLMSYYAVSPSGSSPSSSSNLVIRSPSNGQRQLPPYWPLSTPTITVSEVAAAAAAYHHQPSPFDKMLEMNHNAAFSIPSTYMHNHANLQSPLHVPSPPSDWSDAERSSMRLPGRLPGQRVDVDPKMLINSFADHDDDSKLRRTILDDIQQQDWFRQHMKEPTIETRNDPLARGLGTVGRSIYTVFLVEDKESNQWRCLFGSKGNPCKKSGKQFERVERAIEHVRSHLGHRPFACDNTCHKSSSAGTPCGKRFFAAGYLEDHKRRPQKRTGSS